MLQPQIPVCAENIDRIRIDCLKIFYISVHLFRGGGTFPNFPLILRSSHNFLPSQERRSYSRQWLGKPQHCHRRVRAAAALGRTVLHAPATDSHPYQEHRCYSGRLPGKLLHCHQRARAAAAPAKNRRMLGTQATDSRLRRGPRHRLSQLPGKLLQCHQRVRASAELRRKAHAPATDSHLYQGHRCYSRQLPESCYIAINVFALRWNCAERRMLQPQVSIQPEY